MTRKQDKSGFIDYQSERSGLMNGLPKDDEPGSLPDIPNARIRRDISRLIAEYTSDAIVILDTGLKIVYANPLVTRILGYTPEEFLLLTPHQILTPGSYAKVTEMLEKILNHDKADTGPTDVYTPVDLEEFHKDGSIRYAEVTYSLLRDDEGHPVYFLTISRDITTRKLTEKALQESETKFRLIAENTSDGIAVFDNQGNLIYVSPSYLEQLGYSENEDLKRNAESVYNLIHPNDRDETFKQILDSIKDKKKELTYKYRVKHSKGYYIWREDKARFNYDEEGNYVSAYMICRDITERIRAEEMIRENEQKFREIFNSVQESIFIIDASTGEFLDCNEPSITMFGYGNKEEILKVLPAEMGFRKEIPGYTGIMEHSGQETTDGIHTFEWKARRKNGEFFMAEISLKPTYLTGEKRIIAVVRDISERKKAENALLESDRLKTAFIANISHEIRTPINGMLGFTNLLKDSDLTEDERKNFVEIIHRNGQKLMGIINNLIDLSKIESGVMDIINSEVDLNEEMKFLYSLFKPEMDKKGIALKCVAGFPNPKTMVNTDRDKLHTILSNLLKNAWQYTITGNVEFGYRIQKNKDPEKHQVVFYVKDTGVGIPLEKHEVIFDRFVQACDTHKNSRHGAGLGLAVARAYAHVLRGKIWLESEPDKGSVFFFSLPYESDNEVAVDPEDHDWLRFQNKNQQPFLNIMVVDDDYPSELLITRSLRNVARMMIKVHDGCEAIETCRKNPEIDLILMDIKLPGCNGYEATRQIRTFNDKVIIIAQTSHGMSGEKEKAIQAGCNDYMAKPIYVEKLYRIIGRYFKGKVL